ncbi:hypothetical protein [Candidatus Pantoea persica]
MKRKMLSHAWTINRKERPVAKVR